ncbi:MAG: alpha/beta fold hydrolase [Flavobacteriaceae bacterium]|jgi:esterase|nr:alpha/beta fold hydrolase [Flavobacteriaceae bacterium]
MLLHSNILGEGKPFVILHGFLGMGDNWKSLGKRFSEQGYQVHLVDQRNHGRSFHSESFNYNFLAEDLKIYCDFHKLEDFILLGHSMGGKTAMNYAVNYPDNLSKLIIADIGPKQYPLHHQDILKALSVLDFSIIKTRKTANNVISEYIKNNGVRLFLAKNLYWKHPDELALRINLPVLIENIEEVGKLLSENLIYRKETLFLRGANSNYIEKADEFLIKKQFPNSDIQTIKNAGHWLHAENPKDFYNKVMNFISI